MLNIASNNRVGFGFMLVFIVIILGIAGYLFFADKYRRTNDDRVLSAELFNPYFAAIDAGRYDEAWSKYTTKRYRDRFLLEQFKEHQEKIKLEGGIPERTMTVATRGYDALVKQENITVKFSLIFRMVNQAETIRYTVVKENERLMIDESYRVVGSGRAAVPEPW